MAKIDIAPVNPNRDVVLRSENETSQRRGQLDNASIAKARRDPYFRVGHLLRSVEIPFHLRVIYDEVLCKF